MNQDLQNAQPELFNDIRNIIESARVSVATKFNNELVMMYWGIGNRINNEFLNNQRAKYGQQVVASLSEQLQLIYGKREFSLRNIRRMMQFAMEFPDREIVSHLATQLSWSHFVEILPLKDSLKREFYLTMAANGHWGRNLLRQQIDSMLYERTTISSQPAEVIQQELKELRQEDKLSADLVFKDPYFLDFTGLHGCYSENDLEDMLISGLEQFLLELGNGFSFIERQKRMVIDGEDFYLDLLFYHRKLHRLIAIDLKKGRFKAAYKGQMELYLRWLDKYERQEGELSPLGLLLCSEGGNEQIELLQLDESGIKVAQYYTELPNREQLKELLQKQLEQAKNRIKEQ